MNLGQTCLRTAVGTINTLGSGLHKLGVQRPSLSIESLYSTAQARSGLSDIGDWAIDEPLQRLVRAYHDEAHLTTVGRITVKEMLVSLLENLMHLEQDRAQNPAISTEKIVAPVFITGLPRTGTTLLHGLMTEDPGNRVPMTWEVMFPARHEAAAIEGVRRKTDQRLEWANRFAPEFRRIHPIAADLPQECIAVTAQVFSSIQFHTTHDVPSYQDWLETSNQSLGYAFHYRLLQHLQTRRTANRWVLKAPGHLFALDALLGRYPDARIVQTHRDPLRVVASMASLAFVLKRAFRYNADPHQIGRDWADRWAAALDRFLAIRDRSPQQQFLDISYDQLIKDPLATVGEVYRFIGAELTPTARKRMQAYLDKYPKNKHGAHRYSLAEYGLDERTQIARFSNYCERFNI